MIDILPADVYQRVAGGRFMEDSSHQILSHQDHLYRERTVTPGLQYFHVSGLRFQSPLKTLQNAAEFLLDVASCDPTLLVNLLRHGAGDAAGIVEGGRAERGLDAFGGDVLTSEANGLCWWPWRVAKSRNPQLKTVV